MGLEHPDEIGGGLPSPFLRSTDEIGALVKYSEPARDRSIGPPAPPRCPSRGGVKSNQEFAAGPD